MSNVRKVKNILQHKENKNIVSVQGHTSVKETINMMLDHNIGSIVIYKEEDFLGIITERGYLKSLLSKGLSTLEAPASEMVDENTVFINSEDTVEQCMKTMTDTHSRHLPVLENGKLVGMVSIGDVVKELLDEDNDTITQLDAYVHNQYGTKL